MIDKDDSNTEAANPDSATTPATKTVRVERLKVRVLKRLKGGFGAADASAETVSSNCSCSCPPA